MAGRVNAKSWRVNLAAVPDLNGVEGQDRVVQLVNGYVLLEQAVPGNETSWLVVSRAPDGSVVSLYCDGVIENDRVGLVPKELLLQLDGVEGEVAQMLELDLIMEWAETLATRELRLGLESGVGPAPATRRAREDRVRAQYRSPSDERDDQVCAQYRAGGVEQVRKAFKVSERTAYRYVQHAREHGHGEHMNEEAED